MIRCLIVDDEEPARELIKLHLNDLDGFEVVASLGNGIDAFAYLQKYPVDLAFLDINMPRLSGLELLRSLKTSPKAVLTTAYREYGAEAYELDVLDYLVKPITQERFMKAIAKFLHYWNSQKESKETPAINEATSLFFKVGREQVRIFLADILYIEGLADYIKVHTAARSYVASEKLGSMVEKLPSNSFMRIHKSFIVALDKVTSYNADYVVLGNKALPLGRLFKTGFFSLVKDKL
jgi:DNA-binding LytR/AlgR family response regulator